MDFLGIYFSDDIVDKIFYQLSYEDKTSFLQLNNYTYSSYNHHIKYLVYDFLNNDYKYFKKLMKKYNYSEEEIFEMGIIATTGANTVWGGPMYGYYDLRFLFELIYAGLDVNNIKIIESSKNHINLHINMKRIKSCISFNRFETIHNINKEQMLYSLHKMFKITKKTDSGITYSLEWKTI
jgi:hypothetical protein